MISESMNDEVLRRIEERLRSHLQPVEPDPQFAVRLQRRLSQAPRVTLEHSIGLMWALISLGVGVFLGALVLWLLRRSPRSVE
ncbi:MAG: hypothetical protein ACPLUL_07420 [Thermanaerothrix sp.]|uniref:hypothetical protein n=1 Tax=Thermanaerothrix sp. TaxID=2972675 RepID=UPI003C7D56E5